MQCTKEPKSGRPNLPGYGVSKTRKELLPWKWAEDTLSKTKNYFLATTRVDGRPHVMPIWGVWTDGEFYFSAVILEGTVEKVGDKKIVQRVATVYLKKYNFDFSKMNEPIFVVRPRVAFGQVEKTFVKTATRWKFD